MTTHLVLGTGAVGSAVANLLASQGHSVRAINHSGKRGSLDAAIALSQADLNDPAAAASALKGADVIYQVTQPAYAKWVTEFPALQRSILGAAEKAGASVVLADNLYCYRPQPGATITEDTPEQPTTRKGRVRKQIADEALAAHADGRVRVALTRPSNYVGADYAVFRDLVLDPVANGKAARILGRTDRPHSFSYTADAARAMAAIGTSEQGWGRAWITPVMATITQADLVARLWEAARQPGKPRVSSIRGGGLRALSLFMPMLREAVEMMYEFDEPFVASSAAFEETFGWGATPWDEAIAAMVSTATIARASTRT